MTDKTKSQTYNFLSENKSIEDIKKQTNIEVIEKSRHGGSTFKIIDKDTGNEQQLNDNLSENIDENLEIVATNLTDNEKEQKTNNNFWIKLTNYLNWPTSNVEKLIQTQTKYIEQLEQSNLEKDKEIQKLIKENKKLKLKQSNDNLAKFSYNAITIYDEKQRKKTDIYKIHEEILPINNKIYFITTIQHIDNSINEEIIHFYQLKNGDIQVVNQIKKYENMNKYKNDLSLIEDTLTNKNNISFSKMPIKKFLKKHNDYKFKPTKKELKIWGIIIGITLFLGIVIPICTFAIPALIPATATVLLLETKIIIAVSFAVGGLVFKGISSIFENATKKVQSWFKNKYFKSKDQKEKEKKERQSIIKNLSNDKLETQLQTQYDILKQELDNRKEKNPNKLISIEIINHNSNSISENSNIESKNNQSFDSSIRNTINHQNQQPSTSSNHNWNKVKCLLT